MFSLLNLHNTSRHSPALSWRYNSYCIFSTILWSHDTNHVCASCDEGRPPLPGQHGNTLAALGRVPGERMRCKCYLLLLCCLFSGNRGDNKRVLHLKDTSPWNWKLTLAASANCKAFELEDCGCGRASVMPFKYSVPYLNSLQFTQKWACLSSSEFNVMKWNMQQVCKVMHSFRTTLGTLYWCLYTELFHLHLVD